MSGEFAIEALGLVKRFGDVVANDAVTLRVPKGSVHGIVGENGAGKSTLLKMLFGFYQPDAGELRISGIPVALKTPAAAMAAGVGMVHQHFMLVDTFTALENIILGAETSGNLKNATADVIDALDALNDRFMLNVGIHKLVSHMSVGERQRLEILKAIYRGAEILILDEPTAVLTPQETEQLFVLIRQLRDEGKTVLFVTHKLKEIMAVTDNVTVIRAGRVVADLETADTNAEDLAEAMVGTRVRRSVTREDLAADTPLLTVEDVWVTGEGHSTALSGIELRLHAGEVLGIAGVAGNGQTELLEVITGLKQVGRGLVRLKGEVINGETVPADAGKLRGMGLAHVAEDRLKTGVVEQMTARENIMLGYQDNGRFTTSEGIIRGQSLDTAADQAFESQDVRPRNPSLAIGNFSGGNQQKIVIARELAHDPDIFVIGQPTRGVDIGAVTLIHDQITQLRNAGKAILVVSADLDELLAISDRIMVMAEGAITGEVAIKDANERDIGLMMAGSLANGARSAKPSAGGAHV